MSERFIIDLVLTADEDFPGFIAAAQRAGIRVLLLTAEVAIVEGTADAVAWHYYQGWLEELVPVENGMNYFDAIKKYLKI